MTGDGGSSSAAAAASFKQTKLTKSLVEMTPEAQFELEKTKRKQNPTAKDMRAEIVRSLNSNIMKETLAQSPALANAVIKTSWKKSDREVMAMLEGKELEREEVRKIRLAEQQSTVRFNAGCAVDSETDKQLKKLFGAKLAANSNLISSSGTITSCKFADLKKSNMRRKNTNKQNYRIFGY